MSGRVTYGAHDLGAVDRFVGRVGLTLPANFRREMNEVILRNLAATLPPNSARELQDLIGAQVALTLRASDFGPLLEREAAKDRNADKVKSEVRQMERLDQLRRKYRDTADEFQTVALNRRSGEKKLNAAAKAFSHDIELLDEYERRPLQAWADRLMEKRKSLRGRAA